MTYDDLIEYYGSADKAAQAIGLKGGRQTLYGWRDRGSIPIEQQIKYEVDSSGLLKADLPPEIRQVAV